MTAIQIVTSYLLNVYKSSYYIFIKKSKNKNPKTSIAVFGLKIYYY
jgi:hypothetical protein